MKEMGRCRNEDDAETAQHAQAASDARARSLAPTRKESNATSARTELRRRRLPVVILARKKGEDDTSREVEDGVRRPVVRDG
jgi:hypothetical protein